MHGVASKYYKVTKYTILDFYVYFSTSLVGWWSELLTTNHEVPGSIPGSTMCVFTLKGEDAHGDHGLGSW